MIKMAFRKYVNFSAEKSHTIVIIRLTPETKAKNNFKFYTKMTVMVE
jgi:hypothetical protein